MNRRRKRRVSPLPLICLLAVLATIVALRITAHNMETETTEQVAGKLEIPVSDTLSTSIPEITEVSQQVSAAEKQLARAARYINISMTAEERDELAAIVFLEAGNQSSEGQQAVVEVVFNRVLHSGFPDTVHDVLHEGEDTSIPQFSTIYRISEAAPTQAQYDAIDAALYGDTILDADVVFFSRNGENDRVWGQIGDHIFCREYIWR
jgi:spore germination cell wall hydrolase CwlJ-like protein